MTDTQSVHKLLNLFSCLAILIIVLLMSVHPVYGLLSNNKSYTSSHAALQSDSVSDLTFTPTGNDMNSTVKNIQSKAVITCVNSTIKNALINAVIDRPLVNLNGSIVLDPMFVNHTMTDIMGCVGTKENGTAIK